MTEYDYSPEAYDRYMRTQQRIAQWVDNTEAHRPEFGDYLADPSLLPARPGHRSTRSLHDAIQYPPSPSSSSSASSSEDYPPNNDIPRGMQHVPGLHPMYQHQQPNASRKLPHTRRRSSSHHHHHHHRSHRSTVPYIVSPPPNTPEGQYPYGYTINRGTIVSPGPYGFTPKASQTYATSPVSFPLSSLVLDPVSQTCVYQPHSNPYSPPGMAYYNTSYPQPSYTSPTSVSPPGAYSIYAPQNFNAAYMTGQQQQGNPYPYPAAYPPMMYPAGVGQPVYPTQQQGMMPAQQSVINPKPLFYRRIFGQGKGKSKSSSRRSG